ncbi:MAG: glycosyltransferase family 1 protein [Sphingobacteriia bacterium]|nr:glycosyltransferase family 1 protein [Sphingobacteriia bacterium]NCC40519.1 glycosyltransferase family 1 protein [Gammaproteobacteria bacterium]
MISQAARRVKQLIQGNALPAYVLFARPAVIVSYFEDFIQHRDAILAALAGSKPHLLFQLGWHRETPERAAEAARAVAEVSRLRPEAEMIFLCNSTREVELLSGLGLRAEFCHQNAFLDEHRYRIIDRPIRYDAIYIARITPFKRHQLAQGIESLRLIGDHSPQETDYFNQVRRELAHASWTRKVFSPFISRAISEAHCGLCLSAEEGAMFVSAEYLLSGRPLVSTRSLGGRDVFFEPDYACISEDDSAAVRDGVALMQRCAVPAEEIRRRTIANFQPHRQRLIAILQELSDRAGIHRDAAAEWPSYFTHKLGLRCFNGLGVRLTRILKRPR